MSDQTEQQEGAARLPPATPGKFRLTDGEVKTLMQSVAQVLAPLVKRINELEARPTLRYCGVWKGDVGYGEGAAVTHDGSVWIAKAIASPGARPGENNAWQLAVKRGKDGRDR
jgi:hypothetical protein